MRIEFAKAMAQLLQDLANELAYLAQRMIRRNPLLRPNVREKAALILEPSAHLTLPQNHCGKSESPPLRSGELFQQTARRDDTNSTLHQQSGPKIPSIKESPGRAASAIMNASIAIPWHRARTPVGT